MKPSFDNLKGRRVYQFILDEKTGKIEDISDSMDYVKIVRCKDCINKPLCTIYRETNDDYGYCALAERKEK